MPDYFPAKFEHFLRTTIADGGTVTAEPAAQALAYSRDLRLRGEHADFLNATFDTPGEWKFAVRDYHHGSAAR